MKHTHDYPSLYMSFILLSSVACLKFEPNHRCTMCRFFVTMLYAAQHGFHTSIWFLGLYNGIPLMYVRHNPSRSMHHLPLCFPWCPLTHWAVFPSSHPHSASLPRCHLWEREGGWVGGGGRLDNDYNKQHSLEIWDTYPLLVH